MTRRQLAGAWTALITPFTDNGEIDFDAISNMVEKQIAGGITGILVVGTTGESPTLTEEECTELISRVKEMTNGRLKLMAGCGTNCTSKSIKKAKAAKEAGADVLMIVNPYYNKPTQQGLYLHYKAVAQATDLPTIAYNIKGRTGVNLETDTLMRLVTDVPNLVGVKEASGNMEQMKEVIARRPDSFTVFSGDDGLTLELMRNGGDGVISVASNIVPDKVAQMVESVLDGNMEEAEATNNKLQDMFGKLFVETNPIPVKYAAHKMGMCKLNYRLPMCEPSDQAKSIIDEMLTNYELV